jgi:hypothetical protein
MLADSSKRLGLLFGILLILALYGLTVAVHMLWTQHAASLIELLIFALLAADGLVLWLAQRRVDKQNPGLLRYIGVWVLGLIPYFGWVVVYGAGKGLAGLVERRRLNAPLVALLLWIAVMLLCICTYWIVSRAPEPVAPA